MRVPEDSNIAATCESCAACFPNRAVGVKRPDPQTPLPRAPGLFVLALEGDRISALTRFESSVLPRSGFRAHSGTMACNRHRTHIPTRGEHLARSRGERHGP